jgi:hypothetical protein
MIPTDSITTLFLDIGGVLLTNGWDRYARRQAAETFHIDFDEIDDRLLFVEVASGLKIHGIQHTSYQATKKALTELGLTID